MFWLFDLLRNCNIWFCLTLGQLYCGLSFEIEERWYALYNNNQLARFCRALSSENLGWHIWLFTQYVAIQITVSWLRTCLHIIWAKTSVSTWLHGTTYFLSTLECTRFSAHSFKSCFLDTNWTNLLDCYVGQLIRITTSGIGMLLLGQFHTNIWYFIFGLFSNWNATIFKATHL